MSNLDCVNETSCATVSPTLSSDDASWNKLTMTLASIVPRLADKSATLGKSDTVTAAP